MGSEGGGPLRVGIVDDHHFMRLGIEHHFAGVPDIDIALSVGDSDELPDPDSGHGLDVLLLDLRLQGGRTTLPAVTAWSPHIPVLMMSVSGEEQDVLGALRCGAQGYLTKHASPEDFLEGVREVGAGRFYLSRDLAGIVLRDTGPLDADTVPGNAGSTDDDRDAEDAGDPLASISPREREVLRGIAEGLTHRQVARRLDIKESTVDTHVKRIRLKRKLGNKADLVRLAVELDLLPG